MTPDDTLKRLEEFPAAVLAHEVVLDADDYRWLLSTLREQLAVNQKLEVKIEQHRGALGYSVSCDIPEDRTIKCGLCEAKTRDLLETKTENKELKLQIEAMTYRARNPTAYPSAMDYAESLERKIESLKTDALIDPKDLYAESSKKRGW